MLINSPEGIDPNNIPLGRFGEAGIPGSIFLNVLSLDECAGAVSFLASTNASYLTGETIGINGGMHARV